MKASLSDARDATLVTTIVGDFLAFQSRGRDRAQHFPSADVSLLNGEPSEDARTRSLAAFVSAAIALIHSAWNQLESTRQCPIFLFRFLLFSERRET
jgi:hypothetical protein